eukprot:m.119183 g.119183  ORF g.119183 m.119183 type:complete len:551 (+) comp28720_c1_seq7:201-1853(+)
MTVALFTTLGMFMSVSSLQTSAPCLMDEDCSLNGVCGGGQCACFAPWSTREGDLLECGRLDTLPGPKTGIYGQDPHIASWGGNAVLHTDGFFHLFVSEMTEGCGLSHWPSNMQVAHARSLNVTGPYAKVDTALPAQATNPQVIVDANGDWWLFHIGDADGRSGFNCSAPHPPPAPPPGVLPSPGCPAYGPTPPQGFTCHTGTCGGSGIGPDCGPTLSEPKLQHICGKDYNSSEGKAALASCAHDAAVACNAEPKCVSFSLDPDGWSLATAKLFETSSLVPNVGWDSWVKDKPHAPRRLLTSPQSLPQASHGARSRVQQGTLHKSTTGPNGPWNAVPLPFGCNNPAPAISNDGTYVLLVCTWSVHKASSFAGPWQPAIAIDVAQNRAPNPSATWEDPYIYQDLRGHWHLLAHVYNVVPFATSNSNYISGHGFSRDGLHWNISLVEPYSYNVSYSDGTFANVATRERPKLVFDQRTKEPSYLITAVSPQWPCNACPHGGVSLIVGVFVAGFVFVAGVVREDIIITMIMIMNAHEMIMIMMLMNILRLYYIVV